MLLLSFCFCFGKVIFQENKLFMLTSSGFIVVTVNELINSFNAPVLISKMVTIYRYNSYKQNIFGVLNNF